MKTIRYLVPVFGVAAICVFAVFGSDDKLPIPNEDAIPARVTNQEVHRGSPYASPTRQLLDENPTLVRWLLELVVKKGDQEYPIEHYALNALAPDAAVEFIRELDHKNVAVRMAAMNFLGQCATSKGFPQKEVVAKLLKIAQDEKEDDAVRKLATTTICEIICVMQGQALPSRST